MTSPSRLRIIAVTCLAAYAADLHKLLVNLITYFADIPSGLSIYGRQADILVAIVTAVLALAVTASSPSRWRALPIMPSLFLAAITIQLTVSLIDSSDDVSMENFYRFMAGNVLLFVCALACCNSLTDLKRVFDVWVVTSLMLAGISIFLFQIGVTWSSARSELFPGTGIRTGYFCALSTIYIVSTLIFQKGRTHVLVRLLIAMVLLVGVILSGAKASLLLLGVCLLMVYSLKSIVARRASLLPSVSVILVGAVTLVICLQAIEALHQRGQAGYLAQISETSSYLNSAKVRLSLHREYLDLGWQHPLVGNGISAAYSLRDRTHSVSIALFVQLGLLGLANYFLFLLSVVSRGGREVRILARTESTESENALLVAAIVSVIFLVLKSEVTADVAGNREMWFFAAVLLATGPAIRINQGRLRPASRLRRSQAMEGGLPQPTESRLRASNVVARQMELDQTQRH